MAIILEEQLLNLDSHNYIRYQAFLVIFSMFYVLTVLSCYCF